MYTERRREVREKAAMKDTGGWVIRIEKQLLIYLERKKNWKQEREWSKEMTTIIKISKRKKMLRKKIK